MEERNESARLEKEYRELRNPTWTAFKSGFASTVGRGAAIGARNISRKTTSSVKHTKKSAKRHKIYDKHGHVYYTSPPKKKKAVSQSKKPSNNLFGLGEMRPSLDWGI